MGSQTLGKELMQFYDFTPKMVSVSAIVQQRAKILPSAFQYLFHEFNNAFSKTNFFTDSDSTLLTALIYIFQLSLIITTLITTPMPIQKGIILFI